MDHWYWMLGGAGALHGARKARALIARRRALRALQRNKK